MARIRSVHPGLFTDDAFVVLSDSAQIFYVGLLTEADDQGVFEWKPVSLKMRLRAASTEPVDRLLDELAGAERIAKFYSGGKHYGAIRNFRKFQRPKSPNAVHPLPDEWREYVGLSPVISEIDGDERPPPPPKGEISSQMEEVGGRRKDGKKDPQPGRSESAPRSPTGSPAAGREYAFAGVIVRLKQRDFDSWKASFSAIPDLTAELETIDAKLVDEGFDGKWFGRVSGWLRARHEALLRQNGTGRSGHRNGEHQPHGGYAYAHESPEHWRDRLTTHYGSVKRMRWPEIWGPEPGQPGCRVPPDVLAEFTQSAAE